MSRKDKIAIAIVIILTVIFGLAVSTIAANVNISGVSDLGDLANMATYNKSDFMNLSVDSLAEKYITQNGNSIYYKSGMCMYHMQSTDWNDVSKFYIYNVFDFDMIDGELILKNNGNVVTNTNSKTWALARSLYEAWKNSPNYNTEAWGGNSYKNTALRLFYEASKDGLGIIDGDFYGAKTLDGTVSSSNDNIKYGQQAKEYQKIRKENEDSDVSAVNNGTYTIIGPLKVSYKLKKVEKIKIESATKTLEQGDNGLIYYITDYSSVEAIADDITTVEKNMSNTITNIPSGKNFYIIVEDKNEDYIQGDSIKVTATQQTMEYYKVRLIIAGKKVNRAQQTGIFAGDDGKYSGNVSWNVTDIPKGVDLTIEKKNENNETIEGIGFKIKATKDGADYWLTYTNNTINYGNTNINADNTEWHTNANGKIEIKGLDVEYTYTIYETSIPSGYLDLKYQVGAGMTVSGTTRNNNEPYYDSNLGSINCGTITGTNGGDVEVSISNTQKHTDIIIAKTDEIGVSTNIKNAGFKIYAENSGWVSYDSNTYTYSYNSSYNDATEWNTGEGSSIEIYGLSTEYSYTIYETKAPDNFLSLEEQVKAEMTITKDGNTVTPTYEEGKGINCGTISSSDSSQNITFNIKNIEDYLRISGIIWEDSVGTKSDDYDSVYTDSDNLYTGTVKVSLLNSSGETVKTVTTTTGEYVMETEITVAFSMTNEQIAEKLKGYYIKFEYDSEYKEENSTISYKGTVVPTTGTNGSKALPNENEETKGIAYIYELSSYVNDTNYDKSSYTLQYMNMGLVNISDSYDYNIEETIAYVKVAINGYTYTYEYGGTGKTAATAAPKVQWDNGWAYSRPIYPSDIAYSVAEGWDKDSSLKVYVVYRIDIKDIDPNGKSSMTKEGTTEKQVSYVENNLKVENLINSYDTSRYELETKYDKSTNGDFENWKKDSDGVAKYTGDKLNNTIAPDETRTVYIQFKVKDNELENLLSSGATYENKPTVATAKAYHNFWKSYYGWNSSKSIELFKPDEKTAEVEKSAESIYLKLELGTERTVTGKVFEDKKVSTNGEALGNGKYEDNENTIKDVTVDLLLEDGTTASLYSKANEYKKSDAKAVSANDGTYSFVGVTPGKYYIRFTYGDGTQKIVDTSGNEVGTVTIKDYKSTIITEDNIKNALIKGDEDWYKKVSDTIHSTAVDNLEQRGEYNKDTTSRNTIDSTTPLTSISIENTIEDTVAITADNDGAKETIIGMNFGIIKNPIVEIITEKVVSYIKITNTQGNIIAEGNPATQNIPYVSDLDGNKHLVDGSTYVKVEINEQELYGSTLEIQYSITVQNKSELNYYEDEGSYYGYYYKFGDKSHAKEVTYKVGTVYDYIDSSVKSEDISTESPYAIEIVTISDDDENNKYEKTFVNNIEEKTGYNYDYLIKITGWQKELYSAIVERTDDNSTTETANLNVSRLLSADSDDLEVSNVAQVIDVGVPDTPLIPPVGPQEPTNEVITTVIPPTGSDMLTTAIYIVTIIIAGALIVVGIIFIKKKVIDK